MTRTVLFMRAVAVALLLAAAPPGDGSAARAAAEAGVGRRPNHLLGQSSPYLLEHLDNPVDWYPWGEEVLERARREGRPIFLSIGYSACHWCHVMAREAFSDEGIARILNERFVPIKVDREERPDLDDLYMTSVLAMNGSGGWPLSVFLTPDRKPFYGGTYLPKDRFRQTLLAIDDAWTHRRPEVLASADKVREALEQARARPVARAGEGPGGAARQAGGARGSLRDAVARLEATFDRANGGFGGAPKFPPHGALRLLLEADRRGEAGALDLVVRTLEAMARGGLYDQIGGGFHRYATDAAWLVPHFEKMLYDNALLVPLYLEAWKRTGRDDFRRVAEETLAWAVREMTDTRGGFCASLDADSEGEEGRYYLWTPEEVRTALGPSDAAPAIAWFGLGDGGRFTGGRGLPHQARPLEAFAREQVMTPDAARARIEVWRRGLFEARAGRVPPRRDGKVLTAWNGLMISALARAYAATGDDRYRAAGVRTALFLRDHVEAPDGRLRVSWIDGTAGPPGYLDDSAFLARGLIDLYDATADRTFLDEAARIARGADRFLDREAGGYFFAAADQKDLLLRTMSFEDQALPSGNAVMVETLARLARALRDPAPLETARHAVGAADPILSLSALAAPSMFLAAELLDRARPGAAIPAAVVATVRAGLIDTPALAAAPARPTAPAEEGDRLIKGTVVGRGNAPRVVESSVAVPEGTLRPGQSLTVSVGLDIQPGWHVNSSRPTLEYLIPTKIELADPSAATVEDLAYPEGMLVTLKFAEEKLSVYQGATMIRATLSPPRDSGQGPRTIPILLTYQACSDRTCLAPEKVRFEIPIVVRGEPVAATAAWPAAPIGDRRPPAASRGGLAALLGSGGAGGEGVRALMEQRGLAVLLGVVFLAGLALNLTPCVYPMMPVTIGYFLNQASGGWGRRIGLPALYVLGMAVTYSILGVVAGLTGSLFGSMLQKPWVTGLLALIFIVMALSMFGLFEIRMPGFLTRITGGRRGAVGAFLMGLTMGVAAAPCIGPFIVPLLAFVGASGTPALGFWLFFVMAIGMGLPNLVLGVFSGALAGLPRSGSWLIYVKKVMGTALLAVALYFLQPYLPDRPLGWIVLAFALLSGIYLAIFERTKVAAGWFRPLKAAVGLAVVAGGAWIAVPMVGARPEPIFHPYGAEALDRARSEGRPVIVDFFAAWCVPCKELDRFTFSDPRVLEEADRFLMLKADLTSFESASVREVRERFAVLGVPTVVFLDGRGEERKDLRVYGFEDPASFLARMRQVH